MCAVWIGPFLWRDLCTCHLVWSLFVFCDMTWRSFGIRVCAFWIGLFLWRDLCTCHLVWSLCLYCELPWRLKCVCARFGRWRSVECGGRFVCVCVIRFGVCLYNVNWLGVWNNVCVHFALTFFLWCDLWRAIWFGVRLYIVNWLGVWNVCVCAFCIGPFLWRGLCTCFLVWSLSLYCELTWRLECVCAFWTLTWFVYASVGLEFLFILWIGLAFEMCVCAFWIAWPFSLTWLVHVLFGLEFVFIVNWLGVWNVCVHFGLALFSDVTCVRAFCFGECLYIVNWLGVWEVDFVVNVFGFNGLLSYWLICDVRVLNNLLCGRSCLLLYYM